MRDTEELKEDPFFRSIDWKALAAKQVTPPFIPVVESDESTAYFDPEFTSADVNADEIGGVFDDEDPSEDWVMSASFTSDAGLHMPNGPLGSDVTVPTLHAVKGAQAAGLHAPAPVAPPVAPPVHRRIHDPNSQEPNGNTNANGQPQRPQHAPIQINTRKGAGRGRAPQGSPISSSVQEKFRGFSFTGESFVHGVDGKLAEDKPDPEVEVIDADDLDGEGDEWEDEEDDSTSPTAVNGNGGLGGGGGVGERRNGVAPGSRKKGRKGGRSGVSSPLSADEYDDGRLGGRVATAKKWSDMDGYL